MKLTQSLREKIECLSPAQQQQLSDFVDQLMCDAQNMKTKDSLIDERTFIPQTPLGKKLWDIRQRAIAAGMKLRPAEEIAAELSESRDRLPDLDDVAGCLAYDGPAISIQEMDDAISEAIQKKCK